MPRLHSAALVALAALLLLPACAVNNDARLVNVNDVYAAQRAYSQYVRDGLFEQASEFVAPDLKPAFRDLAQQGRELRFTSWAVRDQQVRRGEATFQVVYQGFWLASPYEQQFVTTQRWEHDVRAERWWVRPEIDRMRALIAKSNPAAG